MASPSSPGASRNVSCRLLAEFVKIFQTKKFDERFRTSSLSTKEFLEWVVEADIASLQQVVSVLRTKMQGQTATGFASIFANTDPLLLREAGTEQFCLVPRAFMALETNAAIYGSASGLIFKLFAHKTVSRIS